jgi:prepilin-type N-terminal cleavage/methylation domain-containing protein/prepilin-type processing-associated H-X9-DG protein
MKSADFCNRNELFCVLSDKMGMRVDLRPRRGGFTLVELLVVIGIIAILMGMLLPALSRAKQKANRIGCMNNIRQINLAASMYAGDHDGEYPRRAQIQKCWIFALKSYYGNNSPTNNANGKEWNSKILKCPTDRWLEWRSYLINGFNDYWAATLSKHDYEQVMQWRYAHGMKESEIKLPSDTILFGEKRIGSFHVHMDFGQGGGNDKEEVNQNMHKSGSGATSGGSNFAFVDGSVRMLRYGGSVRPINLWAITDVWRNAPVDLGDGATK